MPAAGGAASIGAARAIASEALRSMPRLYIPWDYPDPSTVLSLLDRLAAAEERAERYRSALVAAIETAEEGWSYASDYFREKWDARARIDSLRAALAAGEDRGAS